MLISGFHQRIINDTFLKVDEEEILAVGYEDGEWHKPYYDCGGGNIIITITINNTLLIFRQHLDDDLHCPFLWIRYKPATVFLQVSVCKSFIVKLRVLSQVMVKFTKCQERTPR